MSIDLINQWPPEIISPPAISTKWQRQLDAITGLTPNGMSHLRLEFGGTCTWTKNNRDLKYLQRNRDRQTGWSVSVKDDSGRIVSNLTYPLGAKDIPQPSERYGLASPIYIYGEQVGIPRWWISQYIPPPLVGPWEESRLRVRQMLGDKADMGEFPRE